MSLILLVFISSCKKNEMEIKNYKVTFFDSDSIEQNIYFTTDVSNTISKVEFFQKLPNGKYLDYIFDKNESYFNVINDSISFRLNFISMDDYYWKIVKKATVLSKNKEKLSYILTDVPDDSLDVSTSLNTITNYNLVEY